METKSIINQLEDINTRISEICEENLLDEKNIYYKTFDKIKNASDTLFNNAMRLSRGQTVLIKTADNSLTLKDIQTLMIEIYQTMASVDFLETKEQEIRGYLSEYHINPKDILISTPSRKTQYAGVQALLNNL